jgi:hypothetical protein
MICEDLWTQHRRSWLVAGCELRYLRYADHSRAEQAAGLTAADLSFISRLGAIRQTDPDAVTAEDLQREATIMQRWPLLDTYAACFVQPSMSSGRALEAWLSTLPEVDRITLELWLRELTDPTPSGVYGLGDMPAIGALGLRIAQDLDYTTMTLQQGLVLFGMAAKAAQAAKEGSDGR